MANGAHTVIVSFHNGRVKALNCQCGINVKLRPDETVAHAWQRHNLRIMADRFNQAMGRA
jgi:hypothetical protein